MMPDNKEFEESIRQATNHMIAVLEGNMKTACLVVERDAKQRCPVDMGVLRASITSDVEITTKAVIGTIGCNLEYAPYVHNGTGIYAKDGNGRKRPWGYEVRAGKYKGFHWTRGQKPQPFLENAKLAQKPYIEKILGNEK